MNGLLTILVCDAVNRKLSFAEGKEGILIW